MSLVLDQALARLPNDDPGKEKQQRGLGKSRKSLHFTVPVVMLGIRRFAGNSYGHIGHDRSTEINERMTGFRQKRERARGKPDDSLGDRQPCGGEDRGQCNLLFFVLHRTRCSANADKIRGPAAMLRARLAFHPPQPSASPHREFGYWRATARS